DVLRVFSGRTQWAEGFGAGTLVYRVDAVESSDSAVQTIFVTDQSLTLWDGAPSFAEDLGGHAVALLRGRFDAQETVTLSDMTLSERKPLMHPLEPSPRQSLAHWGADRAYPALQFR